MRLHDPLSSKSWHLALAIGVAYAVAGVAWILGSDELVNSLSTDPGWQQAAQRYKGLLYVAFTAVALVLLVRAGHRALARAGEALRSQELQVQDLFQRHPQPMWVYDAATLAFLSVNAAAVRAYGWTLEEFLGLTLKDIRPPEDVPRLLEIVSGRQEGPRTSEVRHQRKDGTVLQVRITSHRLPFGGRAAVLVMAEDVTREAKAREALQRQQSQYAQLHQSLAEVLWLASADGREVLYVSPAFETLYGRSADDFRRDIGLWLEVVHPDDRAAALRSSAELLAQGRSDCTYRIRRPDGDERWVSDRKRMILDEGGRALMIGGIAEDVTATRERDAERESARADLERRVRERTADLERVNAELEAFTRTAAHDLRSPLNALTGFSHLLRLRHGSVLDEDGRRMLQQIENSARHMSALITDLLVLSRVSAAELSMQTVDLAALARAVVQELQNQAPERRVRFDAPAQLLVAGDAGLLRALLTNLLANAWKFTGRRDDAWVRLTGEVVDGRLAVLVQDNGAGFDAAGAAHLFEPFQRFHAASEFSGTGVGLATCRRIVERHGGRISAESQPGSGASLRFTLPLAARDQALT